MAGGIGEGREAFRPIEEEERGFFAALRIDVGREHGHREHADKGVGVWFLVRDGGAARLVCQHLQERFRVVGMVDEQFISGDQVPEVGVLHLVGGGGGRGRKDGCFSESVVLFEERGG